MQYGSLSDEDISIVVENFWTSVIDRLALICHTRNELKWNASHEAVKIKLQAVKVSGDLFIFRSRSSIVICFIEYDSKRRRYTPSHINYHRNQLGDFS